MQTENSQHTVIWHSFAKSCRQLVKLSGQESKKIFISYAWPPADSDECRVLHQRLKRLKAELESAGATVKLDICNLATSIDDYMADGINEADAVLLIGTPKLVNRLAEAGQNNAKIEFEEIKNRLNQSNNKPLLLFPLIAEGTFATSIPTDVKKILSRPLPNVIKDPEQHIMEYYRSMTASSPLGIIPSLYGFDNPDYCELYAVIVDNFMLRLQQHQKQINNEALFRKATQTREARAYQEAFTLFFKLALDGDARACYIVAAYYHGTTENFPDNPIKEDLVLAEQFYRRGADLGHAKCMRRLAESLASNASATANPARTWKEALDWITRAADKCTPAEKTVIALSKSYLECQHARYQAEHENNNEAKLCWARHLYNGTGGYQHDVAENKRACMIKALSLAEQAEQAGIRGATALAVQIKAVLHNLGETPRGTDGVGTPRCVLSC